MNIIVCLDNKNGLLFNGRRQSRDQAVCDRILALAEGSTMWMKAYSAIMFPADKVNIDDNFLPAAKAGEFCFVEDADFLGHTEKIEKVIVYRWNKVYPSDVKLDSAFFSGKRLVQRTDFAGNSHEKITEEIYE